MVDDGRAETQFAQGEFKLLGVLGRDQDVNLPAGTGHVPEVEFGATHQVIQFALERCVQGGSAVQLVSEKFKFVTILKCDLNKNLF